LHDIELHNTIFQVLLLVFWQNRSSKVESLAY